uniref:DNA-directed RNA polymerase I subunit RPA34 isoform X1 n=2 Tax=Jaculus jaculus TaxID=51337 RepID=UPI001E1B3597|nr:DNA-directed RNA polymerase I subunit RPA34 isoform X1 [Jaculus jaculus]
MEGTQASGATRFSCPPNFTETPPASEPPRFSLEMLACPDTELWLIQAPADFAPHCLNGRRVPLSGSRIVKGKVEGKKHRYQVLGRSSLEAGGTTLLAPSAEAGGGLFCAPPARGSLRIIEGPQESPGTPLQAIPACPPPQIPAGLRPRFCAFGGSPPVTGPASAVAPGSPSPGKRRKKKRQTPEASATPEEWVNGHQPVEVDTAWGCLDTEVRKKTKKKTKKQLGDSEVTESVAMEQAAEVLEPVDQPLSPTTSSKKKKPKGTETSEPGLAMLEPEGKPGEPPVGTVLSPTKKRKREKGAEGIEPADGTGASSQPQIDVGLQGEAIAPSPREKREKRGDSLVDLWTEVGLHGETTEPELWRECGLQAEADLVPPKKKKKKKRESVTVAPGPGVMEAGLPTDLPGEAPAPSKEKKKKREKGQKETEPGAETSQRQPQEPEESTHQGSTKKRKKPEQEGGAPGPAP